MKKVVFALVLGAAFVGFTGCGGDDAPAEDHASFTENSDVFANAVASLSIDGMQCEVMCGGKIEQSLNSMSGIASCSIDFPNKVATVKFDNKRITTDEMVDAIQHLNKGQFTVHTTTVQSLDSGTEEVLGNSRSSNEGEINAATGNFQVPDFFTALRELF